MASRLLLVSATVWCLTQAFDGSLVESVQGVIGAENFTYYKLNQRGPLVIQLETLDGEREMCH